MSRSSPVGFAVYNAGTDVYREDQLGGLSLSESAVLERDRFVIDELRGRKIPTLVLASGGYHNASYKLIASTAIYIVTQFEDA